MKENSTNDYSSFNFIRFLASKWKILALTMLIAAVAAFVCACFIKPKFKSTAIVYAPRTNSVSKILLADETNNERLDIKAYAIEEETEQMMEILGSREIKDALIRKFNLIEHYSLTKDMKYWQTRLYEYVEKNMEIKRTKFGAISITFEDWDPDFACEITNEIVCQLDSLKHKIEYDRAAAAYATMQQQLADVNAEIQRVDDSIQMIMEHGVYDFESQSERVTQQWAIAVSKGDVAAQERLKAELEKLSTWGPRAEALHDVQFSFREYQSLVKQKMMDAKVDMDNNIPTKFVVQHAIASDKKAYPKKSIITVVAAVSALILAVIVLLVIENLKGTTTRRKEESAEPQATSEK